MYYALYMHNLGTEGFGVEPVVNVIPPGGSEKEEVVALKPEQMKFQGRLFSVLSRLASVRMGGDQEVGDIDKYLWVWLEDNEDGFAKNGKRLSDMIKKFCLVDSDGNVIEEGDMYDFVTACEESLDVIEIPSTLDELDRLVKSLKRFAEEKEEEERRAQILH